MKFLKRNAVPSILIEIGLISNVGDLSKLKSSATQTNVAKGIVNGLDKFFSTKNQN